MDSIKIFQFIKDHRITKSSGSEDAEATEFRRWPPDSGPGVPTAPSENAKCRILMDFFLQAPQNLIETRARLKLALS